jgi:hypothetical protein
MWNAVGGPKAVGRRGFSRSVGTETNYKMDRGRGIV